MHVKEPTQCTYRGRVRGLSRCSHSKSPCLQVCSGFSATVLKCAFEVSLVSLPEMYNNKKNNLKNKNNIIIITIEETSQGDRDIC